MCFSALGAPKTAFFLASRSVLSASFLISFICLSSIRGFLDSCCMLLSSSGKVICILFRTSFVCILLSRLLSVIIQYFSVNGDLCSVSDHGGL